ncbi:hypothetical protein QZH41_002854 [Actinostola sp. cb2023]|nr:hypothetical protein QZH41_002854 [Actinostola sp. cb2023]
MRRRSKPVAEPRPTDGMRSMWEFVFISQFLRFFQDEFGFAHFDFEDLENAFLEAENYPLFSVFSCLLRHLLARSDIRLSAWEEELKVELDKRNADWNPLEDGSYVDITPEDREHEKDVKNKKKKIKSIKSKKECSKEEERDALIKQEEEEIERMKQEEESEKLRNMENEHRKKGRRKKADVDQESLSPGGDRSDAREMQTREMIHD